MGGADANADARQRLIDETVNYLRRLSRTSHAPSRKS
jgi:hypothetical protein